MSMEHFPILWGEICLRPSVVVLVRNSSFKRKRQADFYEFKVNLVYTVSSRTSRAIYRDPASKTKTKILKSCSILFLF